MRRCLKDEGLWCGSFGLGRYMIRWVFGQKSLFVRLLIMVDLVVIAMQINNDI